MHSGDTMRLPRRQFNSADYSGLNQIKLEAGAGGGVGGGGGVPGN